MQNYNILKILIVKSSTLAEPNYPIIQFIFISILNNWIIIQ